MEEHVTRMFEIALEDLLLVVIKLFKFFYIYFGNLAKSIPLN